MSDSASLLQSARFDAQHGRAEVAVRTLARLLARDPAARDAKQLMVVAARACGQYALAARHCAELLREAPDDPALCGGLGVVLCEAGNASEGIRYLRRACELAPQSAAAWYNLANALKRDAHPELAVAPMREAVAADPGYSEARLELARLLTSVGDVEGAIAEFRTLLQRDPADAHAWFGLSNLQTFRFEPDDAQRIEAAFAASGADSEERILLGFALSKALEGKHEYVRAFDVLAAANMLQRRRSNWDAARERQRVDETMSVFTGPEPVAVDPGLGHEAILVVGIPRSGTSLVEQILSSHPQVEGANEISDLPAMAQDEAQRCGEPFPRWVPRLAPADWHRLGVEYLRRTAGWRRRKPRFTDKNLVSWYLVGAALRMLPDARVVAVRRDPLETCVACYRQRFTGNAGFANDLDDMADYCVDFTRLTRFWRERYPQRVFDLEYEALVREPERVVRQLLAFCDLDFESACLRYYDTPRAVRSVVSAAQVRQPLRKDTARAARYGDRLDGLRERLRRAGLVQAAP